MIINLTDALKIIKNTVELHKSDTTLPYFFIVGAGISYPEIPTAKGIIELCKKQLKEFDAEYYDVINNKLSVHSQNNMKYYSEWIRNAFPNKIDRSNFYKRLISNAKISSANLLLAQILNSKVIANTVFTTNFDDSLKKALDLIGCNHFVSENNMDNLVINNQTNDIQIVHVHGTYNFYDCANLDNEIDSVATETGTISSSQLLSIFLSSHAPIIVGYSGWENDVIMHSLQERLKYATPLQYIWICYDTESYHNLPGWIRDNENISFVIPEESKECSENGDFINGMPKLPVIEAKLFFYKLIAELQIETPLIFSNPHIYYSDMIKKILPENEDVLHLRNWTRRMQLSATYEDEFEKVVSKMEDALIRNNYIEATDIVLSIKNLNLNKTNLEFLYSSLISDFINKEEIIDSFEIKYNFRLAIVALIEDNIATKTNYNILLSTLLKLCVFDYNANEKEKIIELLSRIRKIGGSSKELLEAELLSIGLLSVCMDNKHTKKELLKEILDRTTDTTDEGIANIRFNSLINYSRIEDFSEETIKMIEEADKICTLFDLSYLKFQLYMAKAFHLDEINDVDVLTIWLDELLSILESRSSITNDSQYIHLLASTSSVVYNQSLPTEKEKTLEEILVSLIERVSADNITKYDFEQYIMCCAHILLVSDNNSVIYTYSQKIISLIFENKNTDPFMLTNLSHALICYFGLPNSLVTTEDKIEKLHYLKKKVEYAEIYEHMLSDVDFIDKADLKADSILKDDIEFIENMDAQIEKGIDLYLSKNFSEAEKCFKKAANCGIKSISDIAKTNLSFMIRRNETREKYIFKDVVDDIKEPSIFTSINVMLYCMENDETESEEYETAVENLLNVTTDDIYNAIDWWSNTEVVGEEESKIVLEILEKTFEEPQVVDFNEVKEVISVS